MSKSYVDKYLAKPETLAKTINIIPVVKDGIFEGFHIVSLMEGTFFYSFGLRQGDYIKKINGKKLVSMSDGIYAYQNILTSKKFTISVLRNNTIKELKYEIIK
jgi:type II secretory pathway component PulC